MSGYDDGYRAVWTGGYGWSVRMADGAAVVTWWTGIGKEGCR